MTGWYLLGFAGALFALSFLLYLLRTWRPHEKMKFGRQPK